MYQELQVSRKITIQLPPFGHFDHGLAITDIHAITKVEVSAKFMGDLLEK